MNGKLLKSGSCKRFVPCRAQVMFRTTAEERPRLVFQLGAADAVLALQAAQVRGRQGRGHI